MTGGARPLRSPQVGLAIRPPRVCEGDPFARALGDGTVDGGRIVALYLGRESGRLVGFDWMFERRVRDGLSRLYFGGPVGDAAGEVVELRGNNKSGWANRQRGRR
jgi:hypothetical protein